jgi:hypothetical protein
MKLRISEVAEMTGVAGRPGDKLPPHWHHDLEAEVDKYIQAPAPVMNGTADPPVTKAVAPAAKVEDSTRKAQPPVSFETWEQTCTIAAEQREDWLIPHWAEFGGLHILTGLPFSGKSSIVAEIVACMATGKPFCTMPVQPAPLLVLDLENRERVIVKRIKNALGGDQGDLNRLWHRVNPARIPRPLTNGFVRTCIDALKGSMDGADKGLVVIDTLRSAFAGCGSSTSSRPARSPGPWSGFCARRRVPAYEPVDRRCRRRPQQYHPGDHDHHADAVQVVVGVPTRPGSPPMSPSTACGSAAPPARPWQRSWRARRPFYQARQVEANHPVRWCRLGRRPPRLATEEIG